MCECLYVSLKLFVETVENRLKNRLIKIRPHYIFIAPCGIVFSSESQSTYLCTYVLA